MPAPIIATPRAGHGAHAHPHSDRRADAIPRLENVTMSPIAFHGSQRQEAASGATQTLHVHVLQGVQALS